MLISGFAANLGLKILMNLASYHGTYSYASLIKKILGGNWDKILTIIVVISMSGSGISYLIIIT